MNEENFIPKEATQQSEFLKKYPEYDGRGIKIGIIDSDIVDNKLPGFQKTTTGLPKIIDALGKPKLTVDTSTRAATIENNCLIGLSGRHLKIPSKWENVSDKWNIGSIQLRKLLDIEIASKKYVQFEKEKKMNRNEGPVKDTIVDCIAWFDGEKWRACIDTSFSTNLDQVKVLTNFDDEHDVVTNDLIFCVNIFEDGNCVQIFSPLHYHGTVVTQIAAAYYPNKPESDGLAPGAQIISLYSERLEEAFSLCKKHKVDIINFSCSFPLSTYIKFKKIMEELVEDYRIIITQYAGNLGPFYSSTVEEYSEISEQIFIIGSTFTNDQLKLKNKFNYKEKANSVHNYSSKGPLLPSGARGIDFVAPGAAIVDLPKWYPIKRKECQGTSLAAPQVAGSIACLLSALKANGIPYTPAMIKMALANTAFLPKGADKLAFGNGIIQICDAFEFIKKMVNNLPLRYLIPISIDQPEQKGILLYQSKTEVSQTTIYRYYVNIGSALDTKWILKCSNGESFISYSKTDNFFTVKIDTSALKEGSINYGEIHGIDPLKPLIGLLFCLPITVICPSELTAREIMLKPGPPTHFFFKCPSKSQPGSIKITSLNGTKESEITMEFCQKKYFRLNQTRQKHVLIFTGNNKTKTVTLKIEKDKEPFEICFYHEYLNTLNFKLEMCF